jgi:hypothetical protein
MATVYEIPEGLLLSEAGYPSSTPAEQPLEVQQAIAMLYMLSDDGRLLALSLLRLLVEQRR